MDTFTWSSFLYFFDSFVIFLIKKNCEILLDSEVRLDFFLQREINQRKVS
jgi:hypothetical protein